MRIADSNFKFQISNLKFETIPPSAFCLLPSAFCLPPSAFRLLPSAFCLPPSAFRLLPSAYCRLPSAFCLLPTASCLLPPASCLLPSAFCLLPSASCLLPTDNRLHFPLAPQLIPTVDSEHREGEEDHELDGDQFYSLYGIEAYARDVDGDPERPCFEDAAASRIVASMLEIAMKVSMYGYVAG